MDTITPLYFSEPTTLHLLHEIFEQTKLHNGFQYSLSSVIAKVWPNSSKELSGDSLLALPALCNTAVGGSYQNFAWINAGWDLVYLALHLLDKIEDNEISDPIFTLYTPSQLNNIATAILFCAETAFDKIEEAGSFPVQRIKSIRSRFHNVILQMCEGQHQDLSKKQQHLKESWSIAEAKSGIFFALGCFAGARAASDNIPLFSSLEEYGYHLGLMIQIADDLGDLQDSFSGQGDIKTGKWSLPIAYAFSVLPDNERERLQRLLDEAKYSLEAEKTAHNIIIASGARIYLFLEAQKHRNKAEAVLKSIEIKPKYRGILMHHLNNIFQVKRDD